MGINEKRSRNRDRSFVALKPTQALWSVVPTNENGYYERKRTVYVRVERREGEASTSLYLHLVESVREENGPRQRFLCHLGGIREDRLSDHSACLDFWTHFLPKFALQMMIRQVETEKQIEMVEKLRTVVPLESVHVDTLWTTCKEAIAEVVGENV
jgi:hypothetical protein